MTYGNDAATPNIGGFATLAAESANSQLSNFSISGTRIGAWAYYMYGSGVTINSTKTSISILGVNDEAAVNSVQANLDAWKLAARANMLFGSIATADKKKANTFSLSGTWSNLSVGAFANYNHWGGKQTTTATDNATTTVSGTTAYLVLLASDTGDVAFDVSIDGVSQGSFSNLGNSILENGFGGLNIYPIALRFSGLSSGSHTLKVTYTSGTTALQLLWAAGNMQANGQPRFIVGKCIPQQSNVNAANISALNSTMTTAAAELSGDGLKVYLWDSNSALPTANTWLWFDAIHPGTMGHYVLGQSAIAFAQANP